MKTVNLTDANPRRTTVSRIARMPRVRRQARPAAVTLIGLRRLVRAFDAGRLSRRQWTHQTRLLAGLCHVLSASPADARDAMRRGLTAGHRTLGTGGGYHETQTMFFLKMIEAFALAAPRELELTGLADALLASELRDARLADAFYSRARLASPEARDIWLEPDLHALGWPPATGRKPVRLPHLRARAA